MLELLFIGLILCDEQHVIVRVQVSNDQGGIQDRMGVLFFMVLNQIFVFFPTISIFLEVIMR